MFDYSVTDVRVVDWESGEVHVKTVADHPVQGCVGVDLPLQYKIDAGITSPNFLGQRR